MDNKTAVTIAMLFGAMAFGGAFVAVVKNGNLLMSLVSSGVIGIVSGMMLLGVLSVFLKKEDKVLLRNDHQPVTSKTSSISSQERTHVTEMAEKDKWHLGQVEVMMGPLAEIMGQDVKQVARQLFDTTKVETAARHGEAMYVENNGDKLIATRKDFVEIRQSAGLTIDDIRDFWNQTVLMINLQLKFMEMSEVIAMEVECQLAKDKVETENIIRGWRKKQVRWGDPELWNPSLPINNGFTSEDADIYLEFRIRIGQWQEKTPEAEQEALSAKYSSFNAMLRDLIRQGYI